jgi:predicted  nucleic acid-binding Zn-ribbon protein
LLQLITHRALVSEYSDYKKAKENSETQHLLETNDLRHSVGELEKEKERLNRELQEAHGRIDALEAELSVLC